MFVHDSDRDGFARLIHDFDETTVRSAGHFAAVEQPDAVLHALRSLTDSRAPAVNSR